MLHLDLFSGIGGFALAARNVGWHTVGFCEIDPYCQKVLKKHWPDTPIHDDIRTFNEYPLKQCVGQVDIITGGFPCQPFSTAARGRNNAEDLWPEMARIIKSIRPVWVLAENVPGNKLEHIQRACADLALLDYTVWPLDMAVETRRHNRRRIWIVAHANSYGEPNGPIDAETSVMQAVSGCRGGTYPGNVGMDDGVSRGVDRRKRLKSLGNAIVPQVAESIFRAINAVN